MQRNLFLIGRINLLKIESDVKLQPAIQVTISCFFVTDGAETEVGDWDMEREREKDNEGGRDSIGGSKEKIKSIHKTYRNTDWLEYYIYLSPNLHVW